MKKTLTLLSAVLLTIISFSAKAQDDVQYAKSYMSIMGGISTPTGDFKKTDYYNNNAGFAKRGTSFSLEGAYYVYKNLGIGLTASFQDNGELSTADAQTLANGYNTQLIKDQSTVTAVNRYHNINIMAGPQYSFGYKKFTLDLRAQAGILKSTSTPEVTVEFDTATSADETQLDSKSAKFAYGGLAGLRYSFSDSWDVGIRATYIKCSGIEIENTNTTDYSGRYVTKLPVSALNTTLGITLRF